MKCLFGGLMALGSRLLRSSIDQPRCADRDLNRKGAITRLSAISPYAIEEKPGVPGGAARPLVTLYWAKVQLETGGLI